MSRRKLDQEQVRALMGTLNATRVAHRSQGGRDLSYLEAWDVKATLIRLFGFAGFSSETTRADILREHWYQNDKGKELVQVTALCTVRLTIHVTGAVYQESGAASQSGPDHGEVCDFAIKTAESDALKRAASFLGTQFGLSLYNNGQTADVVRVMFEPDQKAMLVKPDTPQEATGADLSAEARSALEHSLGAKTVSEAPAQPAETPDPGGDEESSGVSIAHADDGPRFGTKIDHPNDAKAAVDAMTANAQAKKAVKR